MNGRTNKLTCNYNDSSTLNSGRNTTKAQLSLGNADCTTFNLLFTLITSRSYRSYPAIKPQWMASVFRTSAGDSKQLTDSMKMQPMQAVTFHCILQKSAADSDTAHWQLITTFHHLI